MNGFWKALAKGALAVAGGAAKVAVYAAGHEDEIRAVVAAVAKAKARK